MGFKTKQNKTKRLVGKMLRCNPDFITLSGLMSICVKRSPSNIGKNVHSVE